jgi:hypothetical protein
MRFFSIETVSKLIAIVLKALEYAFTESMFAFVGVCYPVQSRTRPRRHLLAYLAPVIVLSVAFNIPKAFETENYEMKVRLHKEQPINDKLLPSFTN